MIIKVTAHTDKFNMMLHGQAVGLEGEALRMFKYAGCEIELELDVDEKTGESKIIGVDGRKLVYAEVLDHE